MIDRVGAFTLVVFVLVGSFTGDVNAQSVTGNCDVPGQITKDGDWEHIKVPTFPSGPQSMTEFGVDQADPDRLYATNGQVVAVSGDGGCKWKTTFNLDNPPEGAGYSSSDSVIVDMAVAPRHVLLAISQSDGLKPHVALSSYSGETWRRGDEGLRDVIGPPVAVGITAADPSFAYLLVDERVGDDDANVLLGQTAFESTTAGGSWGGGRGGPQVPDPQLNLPVVGSISDQQTYAGMVPDPVEGGRLFLYGEDGLFEYQKGVRTKMVAGDIANAAAFRAQPSTPTTILAPVRDSRTVNISTDGGEVFSSFQAPAEAESFAAALRPGDFYMSAGGRIYLVSNGQPTDVSPPGVSGITSLAAARSQQQLTPFRAVETVTLYGRTAGTIERLSDNRTIDTPAAPDSVVVGNLPGLDVGDALPGVLAPIQEKVVLKEREHSKVPYHLSLAPTPSALDVFFDVDTTNSMIPAIDGLRAAMADIVTELATAGIDVWFGVGQYRAYDSRPAFERLQDIAPPGPELTAALNKLNSNGGGTETQLESLVQIATGRGSTQGVGIGPNQGATWRRGSLRMVVNMTDEPISEGTTDEEGGGPFHHPPYEEVGAAMRAKDILHFGIAVQNEATEQALGAPLPGLEKISRVTGSWTPRGGADCNGDDIPDLYSGEPLVCVIDHVNSRDAGVIGGAIISVLKSIVDINEVNIVTRVNGGSSEPEVAAPDSPVITGVNFKAFNEISFNIDFTCPSVERTETFPITIKAERAAGVLASANATLVCEPRPEPPAPAPPAPLVIFAAPPPAPPNLPQHPNPNPHPNPNHNPAPQSQAQAQGALAAQEEEQSQVAVVYEMDAGTNPARQGSNEEYSMSSYSAHKGSADALFLVMAVVLTLSFGTGLVLRERLGVSYAHQHQSSIGRSRSVRRRRYGR